MRMINGTEISRYVRTRAEIGYHQSRAKDGKTLNHSRRRLWLSAAVEGTKTLPLFSPSSCMNSKMGKLELVACGTVRAHGPQARPRLMNEIGRTDWCRCINKKENDHRPFDPRPLSRQTQIET
jgi:hypothetical protein